MLLKIQQLHQRLCEMGCNRSRCWFGARSDKPDEAVTDEAEGFLKHASDSEGVAGSADGSFQDPPPASRALLDFAQRMSEDIVAQALHLCWEAAIRYDELPFIDSDADYVNEPKHFFT